MRSTPASVDFGNGMTPEICPHCGAEVPKNAKACPTCGSDETTGWSEDATADRLDLPRADFDYEAFVQEEFGNEHRQRSGFHWFWAGIAVLLLTLLLWGWLRYALH